MMGINSYIPILKGKGAEFRALRFLPPSVRCELTPLIEIQRREHAAGWVANQLEKSWGPLRPILLDFPYFDGQAKLVEDAVRLATDKSILPILVVGPERSITYRQALKTARTNHGCQICVRLPTAKMSDLSFLRTGISELLAELGATPQFSHILLDFAYLETKELNSRVALAVRALKTIGNVKDYSSVTIAATGFPFNLMGMPPDHQVSRTELILWENVVAQNPPRIPNFGDYGIAHPEVDDSLDPKKANPTPSIRYTASRDWIVLKRRSKRKAKDKSKKGKVSTRKRDYTPFRTVCQALIRRTEFCGAEFSPGDLDISRVARRTLGTGTPIVWRRIGTSHHLCFVVHQRTSKQNAN
jgi:hypothetical protein